MRTAIVVLLVLCAVAGAERVRGDQPHYYVLLEPGNYRCYCGWYGVMYCETVTGYDGGDSIVFCEWYYPSPATFEERWRIDAEGDVWRVSPTKYSDGSPELWLDVPLTTGKSWTNQFDEYGMEYLSFTVEGPEMVDTMFGYVLGVAIHMDWATGGALIMGRYIYVNGFGLVRYDWTVFDAHFQLCEAVIGTESRTWGEVKALFR
ncbi:MAG TPA: hypothetical protein PLL30_01925 [Candidatus Krumholzibacteria bacterium]|nr:hypothetical protein [Candidatus Krumholzibacteria bacterium]HPD70524.1 hypothetical protein [Candidatus Krumholzibacteria bacterium]HRY39776.1 hypothetical protein [Candidatus Krumholzibacteria bacterium]